MFTETIKIIKIDTIILMHWPQMKAFNMLLAWTKLIFDSKVIEAVVQRCSVKKEFLEILQNSQENNFIKKETLAQVFSCEFCKIFKNTFFL